MGENYLTTNFISDINDKWVDGYWRVVQEGWKRQNPRIISEVVGFKYDYPRVKKIIYNFKNPDKPATIVFWGDDTKTVVRCSKEEFNKEAGLAQCFLKKCLDCSRKDIKKLIDSADIQE